MMLTMTMPRFLLLGALIVSLSNGFVTRRASPFTRPLSSLQVGSVLVHQDELSSRILLNKARECAFSDYTNGVEAGEYLTRILEIESGCVSGLLAGNELCENIDDVAEIVAQLRQKVQRHAVTPVATTAAFIPASLGITALLFVLASTFAHGQDAISFTIQEWVWAAKGGFLPTMVSHLIRNGGL
ncbi:hypothetical protein MPSEU_000713800 [Mayamaea pseudoterrestris]|nr:hypothetical protein MPSEU_000713800 [Mayamaea pseudoterrestris]